MPLVCSRSSGTRWSFTLVLARSFLAHPVRATPALVLLLLLVAGARPAAARPVSPRSAAPLSALTAPRNVAPVDALPVNALPADTLPANALSVNALSVNAAPTLDDEDVSDPFLTRLLQEINDRRDAAGTPPFTFVPRSANDALDTFFAQAAPAIAWPSPCLHNDVDGALAWDYVLAAGFGGEARGEVLACPGPEPYWTPGRVAEIWWTSPVHHEILYADADANAIACSAYGMTAGQRRNRSRSDAASAVICVTFRS